MIRLFYFLLFIGLSVTAQNKFNYSHDFSALQAKAKDKKSALNYPTLLERFKNNDATLTEAETLALLIGYTTKAKYLPRADLFKESVIFSLNDEGKYEDAIGLATKYLQENPVSLKANFAKAQAFKKLQKNDSAAFYDKKWQKILRTMFYSGNGMTAESPVFSLGNNDAIEFIEFYIGAKPLSSKESKDTDGHIIQIWEAMLGEKKLTLYFIAHHAAIKMDEK